MKNTNKGLLWFNLPRFSMLSASNIGILLLFSCLFMLASCSSNTAQTAATKAGKQHIVCIMHQANKFRIDNPNQETYPLFNIAYKHCSPEREEAIKMTVLHLENLYREKNDMGNIPAQVKVLHEQAMITFTNDMKNMALNHFKIIYQHKV